MASNWHDLTDLTGERRFTVTSVELAGSGVSIHGEFDLPPLAGLRYEDQVFVSEFVRCHGSIKHMEKAFGVSYPTIKNRLNRIAGQLQMVSVNVSVNVEAGSGTSDEVLDLLERGEITADEAAERLRR